MILVDVPKILLDSFSEEHMVSVDRQPFQCGSIDS